MTWGFGKAILFGEHTVVYDGVAVAAALDLGVRASATTAPDGPTRMNIPAWGITVTAEDQHPVARALALLSDRLGAPATNIDVDASVPAAVGLGSSAALCVALSRLLARSSLTRQQLHDVANAGEAIFHKNPSGVDVALAADGGIGEFRRGVGLKQLLLPPFSIAVGLSGEPRRTSDMVQRVAERRSESAQARRALSRLSDISAEAIPALRGRALEHIGELFSEAHRLLVTLGVGSEGLQQLVDSAMAAGAHGAKLTGAGGGGAVIAVAEEPAVIVREWHGRGWQAFHCRIGATQ